MDDAPSALIEHQALGQPLALQHHQTPGQLGAGQGLALHSTLLAVVGGSLTIDSQPGMFTRVTLWLPALAN